MAPGRARHAVAAVLMPHNGQYSAAIVMKASRPHGFGVTSTRSAGVTTAACTTPAAAAAVVGNRTRFLYEVLWQQGAQGPSSPRAEANRAFRRPQAKIHWDKSPQPP